MWYLYLAIILITILLLYTKKNKSICNSFNTLRNLMLHFFIEVLIIDKLFCILSLNMIFKAIQMAFIQSQLLLYLFFFVTQRKEQNKTKRLAFLQETSKSWYTNNNDNKEENSLLLHHFLFWARQTLHMEHKRTSSLTEINVDINNKKEEKSQITNLTIPIQTVSYISTPE